MRLMFLSLSALTLLLAACGTPQEQCINRATKEVRTLNRLIAETQGNLARGYAFAPETRTRWSWEICDRFTSGSGQVQTRMCWEPNQETIQRPAAIDPEVETRKLEGLLARRDAYLKAAEPAIAACRATYPE